MKVQDALGGVGWPAEGWTKILNREEERKKWKTWVKIRTVEVISGKIFTVLELEDN